MFMVGLLMHIDSVITGENAFKFTINIKISQSYCVNSSK